MIHRHIVPSQAQISSKPQACLSAAPAPPTRRNRRCGGRHWPDRSSACQPARSPASGKYKGWHCRSAPARRPPAAGRYSPDRANNSRPAAGNKRAGHNRRRRIVIIRRRHIKRRDADAETPAAIPASTAMPAPATMPAATAPTATAMRRSGRCQHAGGGQAEGAKCHKLTGSHDRDPQRVTAQFTAD